MGVTGNALIIVRDLQTTIVLILLTLISWNEANI